MRKTVSEIARLVGGRVVGDGATVITGFSGIDEAKNGDITFLSNARYTSKLKESRAGAVFVVNDSYIPVGKSGIVVENPSLSFSRAISALCDHEPTPAPGVHPSAVVSPAAVFGKNVSIGPHAVIEDGVKIGDDAVIGAGVYIGHHATLGDACRIYPNVTITHKNQIGNRVIIHSGTVIGSDGFGYVQENGEHVKIPQIGNVVIEDDVEIGANVTVDRARFDKTLIGRGTKIDNLVQIAHNVFIGEHCIIISQAGVSGSVKIGKNSILAGQSGVSGHITIGEGSIVSAKTGVTRSLPPNSRVWGYPERPYREAHRINVALSKLPDLVKKVKKLIDG